MTATADSSAPVGTVVVSGTNHQAGAFASGITPAADSYSAVPHMAWDGIHLASPTATNGQSLLGRTVVAHSLATNPIGMGATPPTDWDNEYNLDPRSATGSNGAAADIDGDGLSNLDESRHGTNPNSADTDSDGRSDAEETQNGSDPDTFDQPVPPGLMRLVRFRFGDPSGSLSEKYRLAVSGFDGRQFSSVNAGFNIVDGVDWQFRSGIRYAVSLHYLATKMSDGLMRPQPDYDCEVSIETDSTVSGLLQTNVTMGPGVNWRTAPNPSGEYFPITLRRNPANGLASLPPSTWIADNESHVLGQHWKPDFHNSKFEIQGKSAILKPVDLDIVHPSTGVLDEGEEDRDDGGYVSVQRLEDPSVATSDVTPRTRLTIRAVPGAPSTWKTRLRFANSDRYKIYRDEARTQEVTSESTEFPADVDTTLWFHGLKKSIARGGEIVTMQININGVWLNGDLVKSTIVQSEFLIQVKAFIPYAWTEAENLGPANPMFGAVAKGDLHPGHGFRPATPGFINAYSTDKDKTTDPPHEWFRNAPFRVCQTIILTPYEELHPTADISGKRILMTAPLSETYVKFTGVDPSEMGLLNGYLALLPAGFLNSGKPPPNADEYDNVSRGGRIVELTIDGGGKDGAIPATLAPDVHWRLSLKVSCEADPLSPEIEFGGEHDSYPAYEIIVNQSDASFVDIHRFSPPRNRLPGPISLSDFNSVPISGSASITK